MATPVSRCAAMVTPSRDSCQSRGPEVENGDSFQLTSSENDAPGTISNGITSGLTRESCNQRDFFNVCRSRSRRRV